MTKQVYNIEIQDDNIIKILKNIDTIYKVSIKDKSINLSELYNNMKVDINDEYFFAEGLKKKDSPQNDLERIFNNIYDFINSLLYDLNKKLKEIREKQSEDIFK
mgnify:CR=1 FL=1